METTEATEWTPAEDFDTGLTADDWKEILEDKYFQDKKPIGLITLWLYYKYNTPCSYTELAKEYGRSRGFYSGGMTQFNYELSSKFKDKIHLFADNKGKDVYWYLPFVARKASKKKVKMGVLYLNYAKKSAKDSINYRKNADKNLNRCIWNKRKKSP